MQYINIYDAKTNLSKFIEKINKDPEIIVICRNGIPVAQLSQYKSTNTKTIGLLKNEIKVNDDFDNDLPDEFVKDYV